MRNEGKRTEDGGVWGREGGQGREGGKESRRRAGALSFLTDRDLELHARARGSRH